MPKKVAKKDDPSGKKLKISQMGIKAKLISMFIALTMTAMLGLGISSYLKSSSIMRETLKETTLELTKQTNTAIENYTKGYEESIEQMSKDPNVQQVTTSADSAKWMKLTFQELVKSHKDVALMYLATPDKKFYSYPETQQAADYDPTGRPWYKKAVEKNAIVWTEPYIATSSKKMTITIAAPVYNSFNKNEFVGVIAMDIGLDTLSAKINAIKIGQKGYPIIIDALGNVVTEKDNEKIGKPFAVEKINVALKEAKEGYVEYEFEEEGKSVPKFATFITNEKLGWKILSTSYMNEISEQTTPLLYNTLLIGIVAAVIIIILSILFSNSLTKPIMVLLKNMEEIQKGNFTVRCDVKSNDEIGNLADGFNKMIKDIAGLINNIQVVSTEVTASSENLAATAEETNASAESVTKAVEEIAMGAQEQAIEAEKGATLTSNLSSKLNELEDSTNNMIKSTEQVVQVNSNAIQVVGELREKNSLNGASIGNIENAIIELDSKAKNITNILGTITSISQQTNLLALNASIEAARAGEAGRGFAVVADEIRKLAEGSQDATKEIAEIVTNIQNQSNNTVEIMKEVKEISTEQSNAVEDVNNSFELISASIKDIIQNIKGVSDLVNDVNGDKNSIVDAIQSISAISEETAAASQEVTASMEMQVVAISEVSSAAEKLNEQADKLNKEINKFKI
jgi:methyl-accepting chemotaxis protein